MTATTKTTISIQIQEQECDEREATVCSFEDADMILNGWASRIPEDEGGYRKTWVYIVWSTGDEYTARVDLSRAYTSDILSHVKRGLTMRANETGGFYNFLSEAERELARDMLARLF